MNREIIEGQLDSLNQQERNTVDQLHQIQGAQRLCRHLLGMIDRAEDAKKESTSEPSPAPAE